jgi:hypothetical protein
MMSRRAKIAIFSAAGVVAVAALGIALAVRATQQVEPFYAEAISKPQDEMLAAGDRMESRVSALCSDAAKPGSWQTVFTSDEVNGWLATILKDKYTDVLPAEVIEPRVGFSDGKCQLGYKYRGKFFDTVVSIEGEGWMASEDLAAVRFRTLKAGALPLPVSNVVEDITKGAKKLRIPIRWTQQEGDPVLLVPVANALSTDTEVRRLEKIELKDGELRLAGKTEPRPAGGGKVASNPALGAPSL